MSQRCFGLQKILKDPTKNRSCLMSQNKILELLVFRKLQDLSEDFKEVLVQVTIPMKARGTNIGNGILGGTGS